MKRAVVIFAILTAAINAPALSETNAGTKKPSSQNPSSARVISPIFGQLVSYSLPLNFNTVFENTNGNNYIREAVIKGETVDKWSEMITVTGAKGAAANKALTPKIFAEIIASGFKKACPMANAGKALGTTKIGTQDAFIAVASCGNTSGHSESALIIAIKGAADFYTVQWAERGAVSAQPLTIDDGRWTARAKRLAPIAVCTIVPGQAAPYPSCLAQKSDNP